MTSIKATGPGAVEATVALVRWHYIKSIAIWVCVTAVVCTIIAVKL